ncbi:MAG TPA: hypothetical protein VGS62_01500 [Streptosporangiaceae bacterium]|nr:hypothetical protein [Streptosporangiaceae bacterium]
MSERSDTGPRIVAGVDDSPSSLVALRRATQYWPVVIIRGKPAAMAA